MSWTASVGGHSHHFTDLRDVLAKASPPRSGDVLADSVALTALAPGLTPEMSRTWRRRPASTS